MFRGSISYPSSATVLSAASRNVSLSASFDFVARAVNDFLTYLKSNQPTVGLLITRNFDAVGLHAHKISNFNVAAKPPTEIYQLTEIALQHSGG